MNLRKFFTAAAAMGVMNLFAGTLQFECSSNKDDSIYKAGDKIVFEVKLLEDGQPAADKFIQYHLYHDDKVIKRDKVSGAETLQVETSLDKPGWTRIQVFAKDGNNKNILQPKKVRGKGIIDQPVSGGIGAMVEPEKLFPFMKEPEDFDAFWDKVKAELAAVPMVELERIPIPDDKVQVFDVKIACAGEKPVSGYLCIPKDAKPGSCPVLVNFHAAGVGGSQKLIRRAVLGAITFDINAHGIENGKPKAFYDDLRRNYYFAELDKDRPKFYAHWYKNDRDKFYFKGMYMRLMRALEYVKSLPEWDGKHLIVTGRSQGGAQVLAACALDHDITFARAEVPAMCDHSGCLAGRRSGWPRLYEKEEYEADPAVAICASYYDNAYFAKRIKCPIWICTGFMDATCPPSSVFAAYNSIPDGVEKHMQTCPKGNHGGSPHTDGEKALTEYLESILKK